jgi:3-oxoacyl-[acyl-carrier protein] reductase
MTDVKNRWVLITGAARGIGRQITLEMARLGANLVLHSRAIAHTAELALEARALGAPQVLQIAAELSDLDQVESMLDQLEKRVPQVDIVFNNAGLMTSYCVDFWQVPAADYHKSFTVNTIAPIRICYRLLPGMIARGFGRIVNTTSGIAKEPELMAYAASKAALDKFVYDMAPKLQGSGVMMNLLDPGWLRTDLGGPQAPHAVESVIPGALIGALLDDGKSGRWFGAQDYAGMSLEEAVGKAIKK